LQSLSTPEQVEAAAEKFRVDYALVRDQIARAVVGQAGIVDGVLTDHDGQHLDRCRHGIHHGGGGVCGGGGVLCLGATATGGQHNYGGDDGQQGGRVHGGWFRPRK
jgi:hypothetical protein